MELAYLANMLVRMSEMELAHLVDMLEKTLEILLGLILEYESVIIRIKRFNSYRK